jgi:hypothetical protein
MEKKNILSLSISQTAISSPILRGGLFFEIEVFWGLVGKEIYLWEPGDTLPQCLDEKAREEIVEDGRVWHGLLRSLNSEELRQ